ncbi:branched-chain amino acid ABC transporter permease [Paracoccus sp. IB05]|uniref:branched-chain amino acid ABC transporter permease n=1 Tax=Paracoccus sp. IB05 TaxID=2779367 RepID=UPI0018E8D1E7|nr:branched-chain amino acid ABC transporter permease [Paracoccus sp. IB05]MBJ2149256.1 branched-chain amino acid ABC transporter permease [Paracoccus sp. IB05]
MRQTSSLTILRRSLATPVILILLLVAFAILSWAVGSRPFNQTIIDMLVQVTLVTGLYIFIGNSGVISFGHAAFACLGGYVVAWTTIRPIMKKNAMPGLPDWLMSMEIGWWAAAGLAALWAALWAGIFGAILMRLSGIAASIATFAMLAMINAIYSNWSGVTGGTSSIVGIPIIRSVWPYLGVASLAVIVAWAYSISRQGLILRAARDEPTAARASGVDIPRARLIAFILSGAVMGAGGAMLALSIGVVTPNSFYLGLTFTTLSMLVVGGMASLSGAVLGVLILSSLIQALRWLEAGVQIGDTTFALPGGVQEIGLGLVMILILMFRPAGIMGNRELNLPRRR